MNPQDDTSTDPLQPADDLFNPLVDQERLAEDNTPPSAPADDVPSPAMPSDYPTTDDGVDTHEAYDEGVAHAAGVGEQEIGPDRRTIRLELNNEDFERDEAERHG